ncbi:hypothetical protein CAJAP_00647 [Camponotus japonicus]
MKIESRSNHRAFHTRKIFFTQRRFSPENLPSSETSFRAQTSIVFCMNAITNENVQPSKSFKETMRRNCFFQRPKAWQSYAISLLHSLIQHALRQRRLQRQFSNGPMAIS